MGIDETNLTTREKDVLQLICKGMRNRAIASELEVSSKTVEVHVERLLRKLGVQTRTQAALKALGVGLVRYEGIVAR